MSEPRMQIAKPDDLMKALGISFSNEQLDAITAPLEPGVIIAGAGTGKTTVMAARVVWLVGSGQVLPEQVLGLTFTRKAAGELAQKVGTALSRITVEMAGSQDDVEVNVSTYDSFSAQLVQEHGFRLGIDVDARLITGASRYQLASRVVNRASGPFAQLARLRPSSVVEKVLALDSALASNLCSLEKLSDFQSRLLNQIELLAENPKDFRNALLERVELADLVTSYRAEKKLLRLAEFADLTELADAVARQVDAIPKLMREQYRVVLLDEYQDTSAAQVQLLHALFSGADASHGRGHPVSAVGDNFQAIYGWRGAAASTMSTFSTTFPTADGRPASTYSLTVNRRSKEKILEAANAISEDLRKVLGGETLKTAGVKETIVGREKIVREEDEFKKTAVDGEIYASRFKSNTDEVSWIAQQVVNFHQNCIANKWSEIAILTRRNGDIAAIYDALVSLDVPVEIVGLGGLLHLPEIADLVATFRVCLNPSANTEIATLLTGPRWQIPTWVIAALSSRAKYLVQNPKRPCESLHEQLMMLSENFDAVDQPSLLEAIDNPGQLSIPVRTKARLKAFLDEIRSLMRYVDEPVPEFAGRVVRTLGVAAEAQSNRKLYAVDRSAQLARFLDTVGKFSDFSGEASLPGLLAYFDAELANGEGLEQSVPSTANSVKLLTIHKSKGLEWEIVFLPTLAEKIFPNLTVTDNWVTNSAVIPAPLRGDHESIPSLVKLSKSGLTGEISKEEFNAYLDLLKTQQGQSEDRLAYVAVTRAKKIIVATTHVWNANNVRPKVSSPYFEKLLNFAIEQNNVEVLVDLAQKNDKNPNPENGIQRGWPISDNEEWLSDLTESASQVKETMLSLGRGELVFSGKDLNLSLDEQTVVAAWDAESKILLRAERERRQAQPAQLPESLTASGLIQAARNPESYSRTLRRPMPRPVSAAASIGSRFHEWVESHFANRSLLEPELDLRLDDQITYQPFADDSRLEQLKAAFLAGPYADQIPESVEVPFVLWLDGRQIRGRIDAVYRLPADNPYRYQVVDWKTSKVKADPLQLACYRLAWAEAMDIALDEIDSVFYHVSSGEIIRPETLVTAEQLEKLVTQKLAYLSKS